LGKIIVKHLEPSELYVLNEIDRSEHITLHYLQKDGALMVETVNWQVPNWQRADGEHSVEHLICEVKPMLEAGAVLLGAFDCHRLAGIGVLRFRLTGTMAQLALLHVSRAYRRRGIARKLTEEMIRLARANGATEMYVSATPSGSAVGFYSSQGFKPAPTERIHPELFELEPEDIHMIKTL